MNVFATPNLWGRGGEEYTPESEMLITSPYEVRLSAGKPVSLGDPASRLKLPAKPGIYLIFVRDSLWYVGKADNIRDRFNGRLKTFNDFRIPADIYSAWLRPVKVGWYTLSGFRPPKTPSIKVRTRGSSETWRPVPAAQGLLRALEQYFIHKFKPQGNKATECIKAEGYGAVKITYDNGKVETLSGTLFC